MLNTRELATLIWLVVAVAAALIFVPTVRRPAKDIGRLLLGWKLLVPITVVVGWVIALVVLAERIGAWTNHLVGDTVVTTFSLLALVFSFDRAVKEPRFMRRVVRDVLGLTVFLEVFLNLRTFNLAIELLAQPALFVLVATGAVAETQDEYRPVKRFIDGVLGVVGITVGIAVAWNLVTSWRDIGADDARAFGLPV